MMTFHRETIKQSREKLGLTQEDLSQKSNVPLRVIADLENGNEVNIWSKQLVRLSESLDLTVTDLLN